MNACALHSDALTATREGRYTEAIVLLTGALAAEPNRLSWRNDLAVLHAGAGDWKSASAIFEHVLREDPTDFRARNGYGRALFELGQVAVAGEHLRLALRSRPDSVATLILLARALAARQQFNEAVELLVRAAAIAPEHAEPHRAMARIYSACGESELALACWKSVLRVQPLDAEASGHVIRCSWELGDLQGTLAYAKRMIDEGRAALKLHAFWLYTLLYDDGRNSSDIKRHCEEFGWRIAPAITDAPPVSRARGKQFLRIGYLSGEFRDGPAFYFLSPLFAHHDRVAYEIFLYHTRNRIDHCTDWYSRTGHWRDCRRLDNDSISRQIERDRIDILVDLSGFFPDNRLEMFAARRAPLQFAFPNCPVTTGVKAIDYIFTDRWTCLPGQEDQYVEKPVFLPSGYLVYAPPEISPPVTELPAIRNGFVTFGLFQRVTKMNARVWDAIAEVLRRCPDSRLLMQNHNPTLDEPESRARLQLIRQFSDRGIDPHRLDIYGARPQPETMAFMSQADIALDTFPYQGQTTTCECLWSGVPVVATSGDYHVARVGSAILERVGLERLATHSASAYVECALELASDIPTLARLRSRMRERLTTSNLLDGGALARGVESAYRNLWNGQ